MNQPIRNISPDRKAMYYCGIGLSIAGLLLFLSTFASFFWNFGNFDNFESGARSSGLRAVGGIVLLIVGGVLRGIGMRGWAGSGVILDPEQAQRDVEPWARMTGGLAQNMLSEIDLVKKIENRLDSPPATAKVRCPKCHSLNDEAAKFCGECGAAQLA